MSEVIGDTAQLYEQRIAFSAVHSITGASGHGHFDLKNCVGLKAYIGPYARVKIVEETLQVALIGPASATKALTGAVAIVPDTIDSGPTTRVGVLTIGGAALVVHSVYEAPQPVPIQFASQVTNVLKPKPLIGDLPRVVYHYELAGGTAADSIIIRLSGHVEVSGVGFISTWAT